MDVEAAMVALGPNALVAVVFGLWAGSAPFHMLTFTAFGFPLLSSAKWKHTLYPWSPRLGLKSQSLICTKASRS